MKKKLVILFSILMLSFAFLASYVSADTHVTGVRSGTSTYHKNIQENHWTGWGVYFDSRVTATSRHKGAGGSAIHLDTYYNKQISSNGTDFGKVFRSNTSVVDSYNNKTYSYDTYCEYLSTGRTVKINRYLGWSSSKNPYVSYMLHPNNCFGGNYALVNIVLVNNH